VEALPYIAAAALLITCVVLGVRLALHRRDLAALQRQLALLRESGVANGLRAPGPGGGERELVADLDALLNGYRDRIRNMELDEEATRRALTNVTHDLRTPLTSALGYVQLLREQADKNVLDQDGRRHLAIIDERLRTLSHLIDQLFEYTQALEATAPPALARDERDTPPNNFDLAALLRTALAASHDDLLAAGFECEVHVPGGTIMLAGDEHKAQSVIDNLLGNVLKHGYKRFGCVLDAKAGTLTMSNAVTNPAALNTERLFERFYTADTSRSGGSTGLGLAIASLNARTLGGALSATLDGDILSITWHYA
jgi:signal transduction histidine kinase